MSKDSRDSTQTTQPEKTGLKAKAAKAAKALKSIKNALTPGLKKQAQQIGKSYNINSTPSTNKELGSIQRTSQETKRLQEETVKQEGDRDIKNMERESARRKNIENLQQQSRDQEELRSKDPELAKRQAYERSMTPNNAELTKKHEQERIGRIQALNNKKDKGWTR